jgi:Copper type II ascorbate-dependent monooxygenase, C-terminal domain
MLSKGVSMFASSLRQRVGWAVACVAWLTSACTGSGDPADRAELDDAGAAGQDAAAHDAEPPDADVLPDEDASSSDAGSFGGPLDRCLEGSCPPPTLSPQPGYEFLSDAGDGWLRLIEADWELTPHSEGYRCIRKTMPEDVYITAFAPLSPLGTHHTTLHVETAGVAPDGVTVCGVGAGGTRRLQGAGVGTEPSALPAGVAMKVAAGEQLMVNLHLFNFGDTRLRGTSGTRIKRVPLADVEHLAEVVLAGPIGLSIPPGRVTQSGNCTLRSAATIYSLNPHMHQLGKHMKVTLRGKSGDRVLHDGPYDFVHQVLHPIEPVQVEAGDRVNVECTYLNDTPRDVSWGDSSLDEMCFVGVGLYPAFGGGLCIN